MPRDCSRLVSRACTGVFLANTLLVCGCGSGLGGAAANTEEQQRYDTLKKIGPTQTKEMILEKKKQGMRENAERLKDAARK